MFKRIDHIELVTDHPERTVAFYTEVLGFTVKLRERIPRSAMGVPLDIAYLELHGAAVEVMSYDGAAVRSAPEKEHLGYRLLALEVDDMEQAIAHLKTRGVEVTWGPRVGPRYARAEVHDPDGNAIELRQWLTPPAGEGAPVQ
jgi:glyoxylase I family protein